MDESKHKAGEPYCSNCGYALTGLTESARCPECGLPLVEVLTRPAFAGMAGRRWRSKAQLWGMPVIDIAFGPHHNEPRGKARGVIALGDQATGLLAIGGMARGVVALGGSAIGVFSIGGMSVGLFTALGGFALGGVALGGFAVGALAKGGGAIGFMADGGLGIGYFARGGSAMGAHTISPGSGTDALAVQAFDTASLFFGAWPPGLTSVYPALLLLAGIPAFAALVIALIAWRAYEREPGQLAP